MPLHDHLFAFEIDGRKCEVYVWNHNDKYWGASASDNDGWIGIPPVHLKKDRYPTLKEAAVRAIEHFKGCQIVEKPQCSHQFANQISQHFIRHLTQERSP